MKESANYLWMALLALQLTVQGCGGGGGSSDNPTDTGDPVNNDNPVDNTSNTYTGSESQAVVSEASAQDLAITAASGVKRAVDEDGITFLMQPANKMHPAAKVPTSTPQITMMGTADASSEICIHGGEATVEYDDSTGHIHTAHLTNCSYGEGLHNYTFTGVIYHNKADDSDWSAFTMIHDGLMTTVDGVTRDIHRTISCDDQWRNCNFFSDYSGYDDRLYRVADVSVTEEGNSAYTASGRIYDPYHGYIDVTTEIPFTLACPNDRPGAGRLNFTGANQSSGSIEFISCTEYVVTTGSGTSNTYRW